MLNINLIKIGYGHDNAAVQFTVQFLHAQYCTVKEVLDNLSSSYDKDLF